ncbi:MAG: hypothetical protein ACYDA9_01165 [Terriglobia bacterium]
MEDFIKVAAELIARREFSQARDILNGGLSKMPVNWAPVRGQGFEISCWDRDEFVSYCRYVRLGGDPNRMIIWDGASYSKGYYLLAYIDVEEGLIEEALKPLERGLELEADHPHLLCEKALVFELLNRNEEALLLYERAENSRAWIPAAAKARAVRGQASCLTALGRFDAAERLLEKSLALDPQSQAAKDQFEQIKSLRVAAHSSSPCYQESVPRRNLQNSTTPNQQSAEATRRPQNTVEGEGLVPLDSGWFLKYGGYIVDLTIVAAVFLNGSVALFHFSRGHVVLGLWSLVGILILAKSALGLVLLFGRRTSVSLNLPMFVYSAFPGTLRKYSSEAYPPIVGSRVVQLATYEILWVAIALAPVIIWILSLD